MQGDAIYTAQVKIFFVLGGYFFDLHCRSVDKVEGESPICMHPPENVSVTLTFKPMTFKMSSLSYRMDTE